MEDRDEGYTHESGWKTALADAIMGKERAKERGKGACMYYVQKRHTSKEQIIRYLILKGILKIIKI